MVKQLIGYLNIILGVIALVIFIILLVKTGKMNRTLDIISNDTETLSRDLEKANASIDSIKKSEDSWRFFTSIYIITAILKEANRNHKKDSSISRSLTRSLSRHAKELSSIRF